MGKIAHLVKKIVFFLRYGRLFRQFDRSSMILSVLKIQGAQFMSVGKKVYIHRFVWLGAYKLDTHEPEITIGDGTCIGNFNHITCVRKVTIGKNVLTADKVYISDNSHSYENPEIPVLQQQVVFKKEVHIGDGAWIGENVCIIGARIGKNAIIGANSVVTKDVPDYSIAAGNPAKVIKKYNFDSRTWEKV